MKQFLHVLWELGVFSVGLMPERGVVYVVSLLLSRYNIWHHRFGRVRYGCFIIHCFDIKGELWELSWNNILTCIWTIASMHTKLFQAATAIQRVLHLYLAFLATLGILSWCLSCDVVGAKPRASYTWYSMKKVSINLHIWAWYMKSIWIKFPTCVS